MDTQPRKPKHGPRLINHESCAEKSQINLHLNMKLLTYCNDIFVIIQRYSAMYHTFEAVTGVGAWAAFTTTTWG